MTDREFMQKYEELLDKGYCNCNELSCLDNDAPRRIVNIYKRLLKENEELKRQEVPDLVSFDGQGYFPLAFDENYITYCMVNVMSEEMVKTYFTDKWYVRDNYVRFSADVRDNEIRNSYIHKVLNDEFKKDLAESFGFEIVSDVRLLTVGEVEDLDKDKRSINENYWTETPANSLHELTDGECASVWFVDSTGDTHNYKVTAPMGIRPVFTIRRN